MTYRVYLRWPQQRVSDKTVTPSAEIAEAAMRLLLARTDLVGKPVAAVLTKDGRQMEYIKFDVPAGEPNGMKGANDAIRTD